MKRGNYYWFIYKQKWLRECYEQLYINKLYNLDKIDEFLERLPRLKHKELENLRRLIIRILTQS